MFSLVPLSYGLLSPIKHLSFSDGKKKCIVYTLVKFVTAFIIQNYKCRVWGSVHVYSLYLTTIYL